MLVPIRDAKFRPGGQAGLLAAPGLRVPGRAGPGSGKAITMNYAVAAGLRVVLERGWPDSMLGSAVFVRCRSGLGLGSWIIF